MVIAHSRDVAAHPFGMASLQIGSEPAGFTEFFFHTREEAGNWRGTGVREVQRAVDGDCSKGLLSFDATECTWCPEALEFYGSECAVEWDTAEVGEHDLCVESVS